DAAAKDAMSVTASDLAALVSQRLRARLQDQARHVASVGTQAEIDSNSIAQYAMAALADELFIIETDWPGRELWQQYLLERALAGSSFAGCRFFEYLDDLLGARTVGPLEEELAAVFLMSLRLGFQGQCRGGQGEQHLRHYNTRLIRLIGSIDAGHHASFLQAYQYRLVGASDERMAPLSRWYRFAAIGVGLYLLISTLVWVTMTDRLLTLFSGS
ncbi:MAG TPA: DotU family type IV/VI secretion system protein, partial [Steroidobacteraceae bacterium]